MSDQVPTTGLRAATFNVYALEHADGARRTAVAAEGLRRLRPDVVALQEVTRGDETDQVAELLPGYHVVDHRDWSADGVGATTASRWPVGDTWYVDLPVSSGAAHLSWVGAAVVEVLAPAPLGPVLVVHHKPSWHQGGEREREQQAVATADAVEKLVGPREVPVVLLGDFDAAPDASSIRFLTGRQSLEGVSVCYQDAWSAVHPEDAGHTFTPVNPLVRNGEMSRETGRRIDYVMVRCGSHGPPLEVTGCERVFTEPVGGVWASDHFGVYADLRVPRPADAWR